MSQAQPNNLSAIPVREPELDPSDESRVKTRTVALQPVTMRIPNKWGVYSPSILRSEKQISYEEFVSVYAYNFLEIRVCFDNMPSADTIFERSELVKAYGFTRDGWYIVISNEIKNNPSEI